jgi:hypothetical protein
VACAAAVAVAQVCWATRSRLVPVRRWHVSESLAPRWRHGSDAAIAFLLPGGALFLEHGRPGWVFYAAIVGAGALTAAAQVLALHVLPAQVRSRPEPSRP